MNKELLLAAFDAALAMPSSQFDLSCVKSCCGTLGCALGWALTDPRIQACGFSYKSTYERGVPHGFYKGGEWIGGPMRYHLVAAEIFDITLEQAESLFTSADESKYDAELDTVDPATGWRRAGIDREMFEHRVRRFRETYNF